MAYPGACCNTAAEPCARVIGKNFCLFKPLRHKHAGTQPHLSQGVCCGLLRRSYINSTVLYNKSQRL